ncbi:MAG: HigA family addiction module antidote protein [Candidatus Lambdaproteobacteria bacterium]|nr:HigA family addiction module antidote protein [Candidatus Lambdaproteobacteria bacterium]
MKTRRAVAPVAPGVMLEEEFMKPLAMSRAEAARRLGVPANRITQIVKGQRTITPETALRLEALFGWPAAYWLQNQAEYDLQIERKAHGSRIRREVRPARASA